MAAPDILPRLERVQSRGPGQWSASCPTAAHAHGDRSRGLSVRETADSTVLLYCFAGCSVAEIVGAVGLTLSDLFPPRDPDRQHARGIQQRPRVDLRTAFEAIETDLLTVALAAGDLVDGAPLSRGDLAYLSVAAKHLAATVREVRHGL